MKLTLSMLLIICYAATGHAKAVKRPVKSQSKPVAQRQAKPSVQRAVKPLYENSFEKTSVGKVPQDFLILGGKFTVIKDGTNTVLELPGEPVDNFGLLFGPTVSSGASVRARISGTAKGRRYPAFGVGLYGVSGYKLRVSASNGTLDLLKDEEVRASIPYEWKSASWTLLRLQARKLSGNTWKIEGKAWKEGAAEPKAWMVSAQDKEAPSAGRPSLQGMPYAGTPIRFDDLVVGKPQP